MVCNVLAFEFSGHDFIEVSKISVFASRVDHDIEFCFANFGYDAVVLDCALVRHNETEARFPRGQGL